MRPSSCRNLWMNLEYSRCKIACSMPPIYISTGIKSLTLSGENIYFWLCASRNLKNYQLLSTKVSSVSVSRFAFPPHLGHLVQLNSPILSSIRPFLLIELGILKRIITDPQANQDFLAGPLGGLPQVLELSHSRRIKLLGWAHPSIATLKPASPIYI